MSTTLTGSTSALNTSVLLDYSGCPEAEETSHQHVCGGDGRAVLNDAVHLLTLRPDGGRGRRRLPSDAGCLVLVVTRWRRVQIKIQMLKRLWGCNKVPVKGKNVCHFTKKQLSDRLLQTNAIKTPSWFKLCQKRYTALYFSSRKTNSRWKCFTNLLNVLHMSIWERAQRKHLERESLSTALCFCHQ